jgi:hypothetical protein
VENPKHIKYSCYESLGPIKGQLAHEVHSFLFTIALPISSWRIKMAEDIASDVLYPEAMVLLIEDILGVDEIEARKLYLTDSIAVYYKLK